MKKQLLFLSLFSIIQINAQENVFWNRAFWDAKPTIALIDAQIKAGNDIAAKNANSFDAVVYAILQQTDNSVIKYILSKKGNDVNKITHDGRTYIFWAAYKGNVDLVKFLIANGAKTNITDDKGNSIVNFAAGAGQQHTEIYDICIANGADLINDRTPNGANALLLAAQNDPDFKLIDYFLSKGIAINSVDNNGNNVFNYMAKSGSIELLKKLGEMGVKGNDNVYNFATQQGRGSVPKNIEFFIYLESLNLHPNVADANGETPLHNVAAYSTNRDVIDYFIKKGVDINIPDENGNTALLNAASQNKLDMIQYLIPLVKNINHANKKGESALSLAVANNSAEVVAELIRNKANVNLIDATGNNMALYLLKSYNKPGFEEKVKHLKSAGFDLTALQENGNTLFHLALAYNDAELVQWVNDLGIDVNAKNKEGIAPIHIAAMRAKDEVLLKYLLAIGANKTLQTNFDESVYDLALENELLQKNNIDIQFLK